MAGSGPLLFAHRLPRAEARAWDRAAASDETGAFRYETQGEKSLVLIAYQEDYAPAYVSLEPITGETIYCDIPLGQGATVSGKVLLGRRPLADQRVAFLQQFEDYGFAQEATTGWDGSFVFTRLPACEALVRVDGDGGDRGY